MSRKEEIREIIKPHFGYLNLYLKWDISSNKIKRFHLLTKKHKDVIKRLPKPLIEYETYKEALEDIVKLEKETKIKSFFKNNLAGEPRKYFNKTYKELWDKIVKIYEDDRRREMFLSTSSRPNSKQEFIDYVNSIVSFDVSFIKIINRIEEKVDFLTVNDNAYLFKLSEEFLDMVPACWCIHVDPSYFNHWMDTQDFDSIWLIVDPENPDFNRKMVGMDVFENEKRVQFTDSLNRPIKDKDNIISTKEFFKLAEHRLGKIDIDLNDEKLLNLFKETFDKKQEFYKDKLKNNPYANDNETIDTSIKDMWKR